MRKCWWCQSPASTAHSNTMDTLSQDQQAKLCKYKLRNNKKLDSDENNATAGPKKRGPKPRLRSAGMSRYRRKEANARERQRQGEINTSFDRLREKIPHPGPSNGKCEKLRKIDILRVSIMYIRALENILETGEPGVVGFANSAYKVGRNEGNTETGAGAVSSSSWAPGQECSQGDDSDSYSEDSEENVYTNTQAAPSMYTSKLTQDRSHQRKITLTSRDDFPAHNTLRQEPAQLLHMNLNCKLEMFYNQKHQPAYSQAQEAVTSTGKEGRRDPWSDCLNLIPDFPADTFSDMSTSEPEDFLCDLSLNSSLESLPLETFNFFNEKQNIAY